MSKKKYILGLDPTMANNNSNDKIHSKNGSLSKEEKALIEFKDRIQDIIANDHDDFYLKKWLKARCYDVNKAEQMYRTSMAFRAKMQIDTLIDDYEPPEVLKTYLTGGFLSHARDGSHLRVEPYGRLDIKGIMVSCKKSDLEKTKLQQCEKTVRYWKEQTKLLGKKVDGLTVIFDMEGVSTRMLWRPGMQMYLHLVKLLEDNYPEMLTRLLVINAPTIFPLLYKLARPLISEDMKNKIHVSGGDYKDLLNKYIATEQLPVSYGGTLTDKDGDPRCSSKICYGGNVPEKFFLQNSAILEDMKSITVPKGDKVHLQYQVEKPGSILRWEFKTEDYDIGFGVLYTEPSGTLKPLIPVKRVDSHILTEDGSISCDKAGIYTVEFDNTFSWTRGKKIYYQVEVMAPDETLIKSEINELIENSDWDQLSAKFETTHL